MAKEYSRTRRVGEQIQRELAQIIFQQVKDPRVGMVTITGVDVSREFEHATVYLTVLGDQEQRDKTLAGLTQARGFLRGELSRRLRLWTTPELRFVYDASIDRGARVTELLNSVRQEQDDSAAAEDRRD
jgi:ribosome-binding factor A